MLESMGFDGVFATVKDYLQPVLEAAAITAAAAFVVTAELPIDTASHAELQSRSRLARRVKLWRIAVGSVSSVEQVERLLPLRPAQADGCHFR